MRVNNITAAWILGAAFVLPLHAQEPEAPAPVEEAPAVESAPAGNFNYQTGDVLLPNKVATLHLGEKYRYMDPAEASRLLELWGNLPDTSTQGAIVPTGVEPLSQTGWAVFLTYVDDGHVDDSDANEIDYEELLGTMKDGVKEGNKEREKRNLPTMQLIGWAEPPRYDANAKKMYWAKEISTTGADGEFRSLNYDVRVLGREGVLSMEAVAPMEMFSQVREDMKPLLAITEFNAGYRYAEFNAKTDRMAEYGLGALIAGAAAAKLGLFGKLFAFLMMFKKFIFIGLIGAGALIAKLFGKKKDESV